MTSNHTPHTGRMRISGYASLFGKKDLGGDIVQRGAFAASLLSLKDGQLPMLCAHETKDPIGVWNRIFEDATGLFVSGDIYLGTERTDRTARLVRAGALKGLSIGYRTLRSRPLNPGRALYELELWEVSIVAFPMLRAARITQIDIQIDDQTEKRFAYEPPTSRRRIM